jgi:hypothetical protein
MLDVPASLVATLVLNSRLIATAARLTGGGDLSADRTLDLAASGVTPATYTNATVTVDTYGRVTAASSGSGSAGTVTSVGLSLPGIFTVSGSPVTTSGTLTGTLATQSANQVWAGPTSGGAVAPTFRSLVTTDIPDLSGTYAKLAASNTFTTGGHTINASSSSQYAMDFVLGSNSTGVMARFFTQNLSQYIGVGWEGIFHIGDNALTVGKASAMSATSRTFTRAFQFSGTRVNIVAGSQNVTSWDDTGKATFGTLLSSEPPIFDTLSVYNGDFSMADATSNNNRRQFLIDTSWVDNTDATRKARVTGRVYDTAARDFFQAESDGTGANFSFFGAGSWGSGRNVIFLPNAAVVPSANPTGGGILYVESGALKYRGSSGTVTTIAPA